MLESNVIDRGAHTFGSLDSHGHLPENQNINPKKTGLPTVTLPIIENRCHKVPNWHIVYIAEKIPGNYQN